MKYSFLKYCFLLCLLSACYHRQTPESPAKEEQWERLLERKAFFQLRALLQSDTDGIGEEKKLFFRAFSDNAFNKNRLSNEDIGLLLDNYGTKLPDSTKVKLLVLQRENDFKTFQYGAAEAVDKLLIGPYHAAVGEDALFDVSNKAIIDSGLSSTPAQQAIISGNTTIPWKTDAVGLTEIPVRVNDTPVSALFDTRANISCVSATYARKLGIRLLHVQYIERSSTTGIQFQSSLGVADSLWIGGILLQHVVLQVLPDDVLYIAPIHFRMNLIIGYPVMIGLHEIHIFKNGSMMIPAHPTSSTLRNLAMDGLDPVVSCIVGGDTLSFEFDTGDPRTDFYNSYFKRYEKAVRMVGKADSIGFAGAGGIVRASIFWLKNVRMQIGTKTLVLDSVDVYKDPIVDGNQPFYGNLGQDIMKPFNETILNFDSMYIDFR